MGKLILAIVVITVHILAAFIALNTFTVKQLANNVSSIAVSLFSPNKNQLIITAASQNSQLVTKQQTKPITGPNQNKTDIIINKVIEEPIIVASLVKKTDAKLKDKPTVKQAQETKKSLHELTNSTDN